MAVIIQVLLSSLFFAVVYGRPEGNNDQSYDKDGPRPSSLLVNPIGLLQAAARLTYPITNGVNNVIGSIGGFNNNYPPVNFPVPNGPPGMNGIRYNEGNARNTLAAMLRYLGIHASDHNFHNSYEYRSSETNSDEDFPNNKPNSAEYNDDNNLEFYGEDDAYFTDSLQFRTGSMNPVFDSNVNDNTEKPMNVSEQPPTNFQSIDDKNKREAEFEPKTSIVIPPTNKDPMPRATVNNPAVAANLPNQGYYIVPISSSNANQPNPFIDGSTSILNGGIINMQKPPVNSNPASVNGNAPGNLFFPTTDSSQPNVIYTIINPNNPASNIGTPTFVPIFVNSDGQNRPGGASTNVYYFVPNNGGAGFSSGKEVPGGIPVSFMPTNGPSGGKIPVVFIPASGGSGSNSPLTFVPGNVAPGGNTVSFIPSNTGSGFGSHVPPTSTSNGNPLLVYVPINGGSTGGAPNNFGSGYLIANKATADETLASSARSADASEKVTSD